MHKATRLAIGAALFLAFQTLSPAVAQDGANTRKLQVVTTLRVLADVAREVGGDRVEVSSLADPHQDPHFVQPRPTLMKRVREADLFVEVGLDLELWAQKVVDGAGNSRVQRSQPGRVIASAGIAPLQRPAVVSREEGDTHPFGNPHVWLDPVLLRRMAENIAAGLSRVDPAHDAEYRTGLEKFQRRLDVALFGAALVEKVGGRKLAREAERGALEQYLADNKLAGDLGGWLKKAQPLRGAAIVTYHRTWIYFATRFGIDIAGEIEEKPGISPSARHRDALIATMRARAVRSILVEVFYNRAAADFIAEQAGVTVLTVANDGGAIEGVDDYFRLIDYVLDGLLQAGKGA